MPQWLSFIKNFDFRKIRVPRRILIFLFFLCISFVFWLLNALTKDYITTLSYPVEFENFPENKVLVGNLPSQVTLQIKGYGFTILQYKLSFAIEPVNFDVKSLSLNQNSSDSIRYYYLTSLAEEKFSRQLSSDLELISIVPDSIIFRFDDIYNEKVPVATDNLHFDFGEQYMQTDGLEIKPDSVKISGPKSIVDTLQAVNIKKRQFTDVTDSLHTEVRLANINQVSMEPEKVKLTMPVSEYTEAKIKVPITVRNSPKNLKIQMFPDYVYVRYKVGLQDYDKVKPRHFKAYIDYNDIRGEGNRLRVHLDQKPDNVKDVRYNPDFIEYIIEKD